MARIIGVTTEAVSEEMREVFTEQEKRYGFVTNTTRVYALRPTIYKGVQALAAAIANAVADAVGVRIFDLPITAGKVYLQMRKERATKG